MLCLGVEAMVTPAAAAQELCEDQDVRVRFVAPKPGSTVSRPVFVHTKVVDPKHCDATFYLEVDGRPYAVVEDKPEGHGRADPWQLRPLAKRYRASRACRSGGPFFGEVRLPPGRHELGVVGACPQGTAVGRTFRAKTVFWVAGALPATGSRADLRLPIAVGLAALTTGALLVTQRRRVPPSRCGVVAARARTSSRG